jgi:hypothetical protein
MRQLKHLSPSALGLWESDKEAFFFKYLADDREFNPQPEPASVGSAFDAQVKAALYEELGLGDDPAFEYEALITSQVEAQNREFARQAGAHLFDCYVNAGFYFTLRDMLEEAKDVVMETRKEGVIGGVPLIGYPDLTFTFKGHKVTFDWKVNGYCSRSPTSPAKLYYFVKDGQQQEKPSRNDGRAHKDFIADVKFPDFVVGEHFLEEAKKDWADQLSIYAWLAGMPVGGEFICNIHQLVAKPQFENRPLIRCAAHSARVSEMYQDHLLERLQRCWQSIQDNHIFQDVSIEESQERCEILNAVMTSRTDPTLRDLCDISPRGWKS